MHRTITARNRTASKSPLQLTKISWEEIRPKFCSSRLLNLIYKLEITFCCVLRKVALSVGEFSLVQSRNVTLIPILHWALFTYKRTSKIVFPVWDCFAMGVTDNKYCVHCSIETKVARNYWHWSWISAILQRVKLLQIIGSQFYILSLNT